MAWNRLGNYENVSLEMRLDESKRQGWETLTELSVMVCKLSHFESRVDRRLYKRTRSTLQTIEWLLINCADKRLRFDSQNYRTHVKCLPSKCDCATFYDLFSVTSFSLKRMFLKSQFSSRQVDKVRIILEFSHLQFPKKWQGQPVRICHQSLQKEELLIFEFTVCTSFLF